MRLEATGYTLEYNIENQYFTLLHNSQIIEKGSYADGNHMSNILDDWIDEEWTTRQRPARLDPERTVDIYLEKEGY